MVSQKLSVIALEVHDGLNTHVTLGSVGNPQQLSADCINQRGCTAFLIYCLVWKITVGKEGCNDEFGFQSTIIFTYLPCDPQCH